MVHEFPNPNPPSSSDGGDLSDGEGKTAADTSAMTLGTSCVPKTWNISDDLGQIEYIFSDKTGTLTQNVMSFLRCSVWSHSFEDGSTSSPSGGGGVQAGSEKLVDRRGVYGEGVSEAQRGKSVREGTAGNGSGGRPEDPEEQQERIEKSKVEMVDVMKSSWKNRYLDENALTLVSPPLARDLAATSSSTQMQTPTTSSPTRKRESRRASQPPPKQSQRERLIDFFRALALCHTVLPSHSTDSLGFQRVIYKAESPDEAALVSCARDVGFAFLSRSPGSLTVEVLGTKETYEPLNVLEFNSTRKRMSVIIREPPIDEEDKGRIVLYCKGADSVIYERLHPRHDPILKQRTAEHLESFANEGLRTLCVARRVISESEYTAWAREHAEASAFAGPEREERVDAVNEKIEKGLHILGATALEDKLQEGVPEAIEMLHTAGIKLWILTGDKLQTAIEIGYSCNLLKREMEIMILQAASLTETRSLIEAGLNKIASVRGPPPVLKYGAPATPQPRSLTQEGNGFAIVIDGETLSYALDPTLKSLFLSLGEQCDTVVCCRVSPAQKALTVKLVKEGRQAMTLAIGDGANDVAMIQEANIGCGLFGLEGAQAAMSADYAFGQFRFLTKLLLVHGRWSYIRVADMHKNFFYKNVIWTFALFWFLFYNSFDATYLYEYTFILLYNVVFTSLPVIALGAFDQDLNAKASLAFPQLYREGIKSVEYTKLKFWAYMCDGFYQSAVIFFIPYLVWNFGDVAASWTGHDINSLSDFGTMASVTAIFAANQYVGINTRYWTVITWSIIYGSTALCILWIAIYSAFPGTDFVNEVAVLFGSVQFWTTLLLGVVIALGPRFIYKSIQQAYYPTDRDIIREMWVKGDLKDQLGLGHRKARKRRGTVARTDPANGGNELEMVSMFENAHARSASEMSAWDNGASPRGAYIPAGTDTPSTGTPRQPVRAEQHLMPTVVPMEERMQHLHVAPYRAEGTRTPLPRHIAPSPAFSYYSADDIPSNSVTPVPPLLPGRPLSPRIQSNNPYLRSLSSSPAMSPNPETHMLSAHSSPLPSPQPTNQYSPPRIINTEGPLEIPSSPTTPDSPTPIATRPNPSRISSNGPGGSRWIVAPSPSPSSVEERETQRGTLHTPQMSEYSVHSAYATAEDGASSRRFSEDMDADEEDERTIERYRRDSGSSLEFDTATVTGHGHERNGGDEGHSRSRSSYPSQQRRQSRLSSAWEESDAESGYAMAY